MKNKENIKKPWSTKAVMDQVYDKNLWGSGASEFYSGDGSHNSDIVDPYTKVISSFLNSFNSPLVICDLGCGDFNVGKDLVKYAKKYFAVDIVSDLIGRNKETFKADNLEFHCLDIAVDNLPAADCVILRQVLQHLSNIEIHSIVSKLTAYKYIILTEHMPEGNFTSNIDIISGQGIRLNKNSGVDLTASPFNFKVNSEKKLSSITSSNFEGDIVTTLYEVF